RRHSQRDGREAEASDDVDLFVDDKLLRQLARIGGIASVVFQDEFDLATGNGITMFLHEGLSGRMQLAAGGSEGPCHGNYHADLERFLGGQYLGRMKTSCGQR